MSDIYMRIIMAAQAGNAISVVNDVAKSLGSGGLGNALGNLAFGFRNLGTEGTIGVNAITQGLTGMGKTFLLVGGIATVALAGIAVALGVNAAKAAGDFEAQTERLVTSAGELQSNLGMVRSGLLQMSVDTATSTSQLSAGMYYVESSGYRAGAALTVLGVAARGAKSENADLDIVSKAITTTMVGYHMASGQASDAMNGLIATVQNGKTNLQDLSASMGAVLPIASSLGISFPQVAGAMDTMTNAGMSAHQASMNLAHVLVSLSSPSSIAVKSMKEVGLSAQGVKDALTKQGLPEALQQIEDAVGKKFPAGSVAYETALKNILGGMVGLKLAAQLTGGSLAETKANIDKISGAMQNGHGAVMGWNEVQSTFNFKMDQAKQALGVFMIQLGTKLLPIFTQLMSALLPVITGFLKWVTDSGILQSVLQTLVNVIIGMVNTGSAVVSFFKNNEVAMDALKATLGVLAVIIGVAMVAALYSMAVAAWTAMIPFLPLIAVIVLVIAIITAIILVVTHWGEIAHWLQGLWGAFSSWFMSTLRTVGQFFANLWSGIVSGLQSAWNWIVGIVQAGLAFLLNIFVSPFKQIGALFVWLYQHNYYIQHLVDAIVGFFKGLFSWATGAWQGFTGWLGGLWNGLKNTASTAWGAVSSTVGGWVGNATSATKSAWGTATNWLGDRWGQLQKAAGIAWAAVSKVFGGIWQNYIAKPLGDLWKSISDWFGGLAKSAIDWGKNLIQGFINGVKNMIGNLGQALGNVGHNIASFLGFHSPTKEGPGSEADKWAPNLMKMYAAGLQAGIPQLQSSLALVMRPVGATLSGQAPVPGGIGAPSRTTQIGSTGHTFNISISTMARSQSEVARLVDMVEQEIGRRFRGQTSGYSAGGVF